MKSIEETISITHLEDDKRKMNITDRNTKSDLLRHLLNDVIKGRGDTVYRLLPLVGDLNSNSQQFMLGERKETFQQPTIHAHDVKVLTEGLQELT